MEALKEQRSSVKKPTKCLREALGGSVLKEARELD